MYTLPVTDQMCQRMPPSLPAQHGVGGGQLHLSPYHAYLHGNVHPFACRCDSGVGGSAIGVCGFAVRLNRHLAKLNAHTHTFAR